MSNEVNNVLLLLNKCTIDDIKSSSEAKQCVCNLKKCFEDEFGKSELDLSFSALFDEKYGILNFLQKKLVTTKYKSANVELFNLLQYLVEHFESRISHHVVAIKRVCLACVSMNLPSADEKERAFEVLISIIKAKSWHLELLEKLELTELVQKLLIQVSSRQKLSSKVLQKEYYLLGLLAHRHPEYVVSNAEKLLKQFLYELDEQTVRASKVEFSIIAGCINGLSEFLHSFAQSEDDENNYAKPIYSAVKKLSDLEATQHRKVANRAALSLVAQHGGQFAKYLYKDYRWWHESLLKWIKFPKEEKRVGFFALETFYQQVARILQDKPQEKQVFMYFIEFFRERLLNASTPPHELRVTIKAFGQFAGPCQVHMEKQDVDAMFTLIVQRIEQMYIQSEDMNLSDYMESLATIMSRLEHVASDQLMALERITVSLIQSFPRHVLPVQLASIRALIISLYHISQCSGTHLDHLVRNIVYQGLVRTCSHPVALDVELQKDQTGWNKDAPVSYKDYLPLWTALVDVNRYAFLNEYKVSQPLRQSLVDKIYDQIIESVLLLVKKLDLNTKKKTADQSGDAVLPMLDPETGLEATTPQDFQVFINLVDLIRDLLHKSNYHLFDKWLQTFCYQVVCESYRKPLVSGFYKLLAAALHIADVLHYFNVAENPGRDSICHLLSRFLQQLMLRQTEFKGDLQVASLQVLLAAPVELIAPLIPHLSSAFQVLFHVGGSYLPLAQMGLETLERWNRTLPAEQMRPLLVQVLQYLDPFLQSKGFQGDPTVVHRSEGGWGRRKRRRETDGLQGQLAILQGCIVQFLGQLDLTTVLALVSADRSRKPRIKQHLCYALPLPDIRPDIHLDELVPRVIELALRSSDRRTRVNACELLHAIVMFLLGQSSQLETSNPALLAALFEQLAMPLLQLGCDTDQVVYQLFNPLFMQLVHWYSSKFQLRSKQTGLLLKTLMDGITHETDTAVRDFSAKCLREFVVWSIKQLTPEDLSNSPINIKAILKNIYGFCVHPCSTKRLGAALVFNSIYSVLREEEAILDRFWLELLYYMLVNLATTDDSCKGDHQEQVVAALDHIERGLRVKAAIFNKASSKRRRPPEMKGMLLRDAVTWIMKHCGSLQAECRHKCMALVCSLAPCVTGVANATQFINSMPPEVLLEVCEGGSNGKGIANIPQPTSDQSLDEHTQWFGYLLASLDCYVWLIGEGLVHPDKLFALPNVVQPQLFVALDCVQGLQAMQLPLDSAASPWEVEKYSRVKCSVIVRTFDLIASLLRHSSARTTFHLLPKPFPTTFFDIVARCVFDPEHLDFDTQNADICRNLPAKMEEILLALKKGLSGSELLTELNQALARHSGHNQETMLSHLKESLQADIVSSKQTQFVNGLEILHRCKMQLAGDLNGADIIDALFSTVANTETKRALQLGPNSRAHAHRLLALSFISEDQVGKLVGCLFDTTMLRSGETQGAISRGDHFLALLITPIMNHFLKHPDQTVHCLLANSQDFHKAMPILIALLQHLSSNRKQFSNVSVPLEISIMRHWATMQDHATSLELRRVLLDLLSNLAGVMATCVGWLMSNHQVSEWIMVQLEDTSDIYYKSKALELLPCLTNQDQDNNDRLTLALKCLKDQHFPQSSSELIPESKEHSGFISAFQNILLGLEMSGSRVLLRSLIAMAASDKQHVCEPAIQTKLTAFVTRLSVENQLKSAQLSFDIFQSEEYNMEARDGCVRRFTATLLRSCDVQAVKQFYAMNITSLVAMLNCRLDKRDEWKLEQQLVGKIGAWLLVEIMFARLDKTYLEDKSCPITAAAFPSGVETGKELIADLTRRAFGGRNEEVQLELFRQSQCAAYNALVAIISNTKTEAKFYAGLLFAENKEKNQLIWDRLIDSSKAYSFPLDVDEIPVRRKQLVSIRKQTAAEDVEYIPTSSQYLFNSTLSEDVTRFDFSNCVVRSFTQKNVGIYNSRESTSRNVEVSLEEDELNDHECMATMCGVIQHLIDNNITPKLNLGMPAWMENLKKSFLDRDKHKNVRLFIVKLILNTEKYFKPYAEYWVSPLMDAIADGSLGDGINYLVTDVIAMSASWGDKNIIDRYTARTILQFLMSSCESPRRDIFKHNLELIRTFVEVWKPCIDVPYQLLLDKMNPRVIVSSHARGSEVGVQLSGIILANGIAPWNDNSKSNFLQDLVTNLDNSRREIFQPCSEVIGLVLKLMDPEVKGNLSSGDEDFLNYLHKKLQTMSQNQTEKSKFFTCLCGIHKNYVRVVDKYLTVIIFNLPKLHGTHKTICLEMLYSRLELIKDTAYVELMSKGLIDWLNNQDSRNQELALRMVYKMCAALDPEQLKNVIVEVCRFSSRKSVACRGIMYDMLMWVYEERKEARWMEASSTSKATLLSGLVDSDSTLQDIIHKFWNAAERLPLSTSQRFVSLVTDLYTSQTEVHFLGYSTDLLLELASSSPDYMRSLFPHPLSQCPFEEYHVLVSWRAQHATIAPMFAQTLASQLTASQTLTSAPAALRATQASLAFQPTQQGGSSKWSPGSLSSSSSLLFTIGSSNIIKRSYKTDLNRSITTPDVDEDDEEESTSSFKPGRRFLKDRSKLSFQFAGQELRRQARRADMRLDQLRRREANVAMFRSYRIGDFPDIEITHAAILKPLQALCKRDVVLGRQVFVSLFTGIAAQLPADDSLWFTTKTSNAIDLIFRTTSHFTPPLIAALLEVALSKPKCILLDTDQVAVVTRNSGVASLGCLLIEERLIHFDDIEPSAKRGTGMQDVQHEWLKLAELYRSLGDWDTVRGIFQQHLTTSEDVHQALDLEAAGNWSEARYLYSDVLQLPAEDQQKKDYYYQAYYKCLAHLSEWGKLKDYVKQQVHDDVEELWADQWNQENLLPWLFLAELHGEQSQMIDNVQVWLKDPSKVDCLKNEFSEEVAMLYALKGDFECALYYADHKMALFLDEWAQMNPRAHKLRADTLLGIQTLAEIQSYLSFAGSTDMHKYESQANRLAAVWRNNLPTCKDSLLLWDTRISYRSQFLNQMKAKLPSCAMALEETRSHMELALVNVAFEQKNFYMARKYVEKKQNKSRCNPALKQQWCLALSRVCWLRAESCGTADGTQEKIDWLLRAWQKLDPLLSCADNVSVSISANQHSCTIAQSLFKMLQSDPDMSVDIITKMQHLLPTCTNNQVDLVESLQQHGLSSLHTAIDLAETSKATEHTIADAYLRLAHFCRQLKSEAEVVTSILRAMKYGLAEARQLFPTILQMDALVSDASLRDTFIAECGSVAEWMFLGWTNQILALLDTPSVVALEPLVTRLASAYPNAVKFSFRLSKEMYSFSEDAIGAAARRLVDRLSHLLLTDGLTDKLLQAFSCLGQPNKMLEYHVDKLILLLEATRVNVALFKKSYCEMMSETFADDTVCEFPIHGKVYKSIKQYKPRLEREFGATCAKFDESRCAQATDCLNAILDELKGGEGKAKPSALLKDYSPWLGQFQAVQWGTELEIPGQYDGESKPVTRRHVTIRGFAQNVLVLPSIRSPLRVSILGNDAKEHYYLVKFGEDLRQDQRIQQVFGLMNKILRQDHNCSQRQLSLATYQVIPLSSRLGLIQWVNETISLKQILLDSFIDDEAKRRYGKIQDSYRKWLEAKTRGKASMSTLYQNAYSKYSRDETIAGYRERVNMLPWDSLRRGVQSLSHSQEGFFSLRHTLTSSHAAMSVAHWLLGIGDRHLSNCLLDTRRGQWLGIDFGYAFGSATHVISIPELMPFRLTPHLVNLMQPMQEHGLFRETMAHCLRALRDTTASCLLLATLEVFVKEPSIDWLKYERKATLTMPPPSETQAPRDEGWFAREKIACAKRKLEGANPSAVTCEELRLGQKGANLEQCLELARGDPQHNVRARLGPDGLSPEEQVQCLLDQATDYHILGKTWQGWEPWV